MTEFSTVDLPICPGPHDMSLTDNGALICRSMLTNGIRALTERIENAHTISVDFWVGTGSADENEGTLSSAHFLEHLLFKGTASRNAKQLADHIDSPGDNFNAGTGEQLTYYYGHVVEENLTDAVELLTDMVASSTLAETDVEMERDVILGGLAVYVDDASEVTHEQIASLVMGRHSLGRSIGRTSGSVLGLDHTNLTSHYRQNCRPEELVVTAAGKVDHETLYTMAGVSLHRVGWDLREGVAPAKHRRHTPIEYPESRGLPIERPVEQSVVVVGTPAITDEDERRYALYTLSTILGGGTSSRLFQEVHEKRGLTYSTHSFPGLYHEGGLFGLYAGCSLESAKDVAEIMKGCLEAIIGESVTKMELETSYRHARANHAFSSESVGSRMNQLGQVEIVHGSLISWQEALRRSREVSADDVAATAAELARTQHSRVAVGPSQRCEGCADTDSIFATQPGPRLWTVVSPRLSDDDAGQLVLRLRTVVHVLGMRPGSEAQWELHPENVQWLFFRR